MMLLDCGYYLTALHYHYLPPLISFHLAALAFSVTSWIDIEEVGN